MTDLPMAEGELLRAVLDICRLRHVLIHHSRPAADRGGRWSTPIAGDAGLPDCVIVGPRGVLWRELKAANGRVRPDQKTWLGMLSAAGCDVALWYPADLRSGLIDREIAAVA